MKILIRGVREERITREISGDILLKIRIFLRGRSCDDGMNMNGWCWDLKRRRRRMRMLLSDRGDRENKILVAIRVENINNMKRRGRNESRGSRGVDLVKSEEKYDPTKHPHSLVTSTVNTPPVMRRMLRLLKFLLVALVSISASPNKASLNSSFLSPNLYFVGFSKCGTTSMARLLVDHPLVVDVGDESYHPGSESHIFDHNSPNKFNEIQTQRLTERLKTKKYSDEIISGHGVMMHYTPNYAGIKNIEINIIRSLKDNFKTTKSAKFLFMIRDPTARSASSWWYKNHCYKISTPCPKYKKQVTSGIEAVLKMEKCYQKYNFSLSDIVTGLRGGQRILTKPQQHILDSCPITLMAPPNSSLYNAHIGKSIYIYQLAHWFNRVPSSQIYLLFLEHFAHNPLREMRLLFDWLDLDLYGLKGYDNPETLLNMTKVQYNVHPIPPEIHEREVVPQRERLNEFYRPYVQALQLLIRPLDSKRTNIPSGNWSELLSEVLEDRMSARRGKESAGESMLRRRVR
jgi:hypothetical protein